MGTLMKADIVARVAEISSLTRKETEPLVDTIFDSIATALARGEKVELRGFGSFLVRRRKPRHGRNPRTGASVEVPEKHVPFFRAGKELKRLVEQVGEPMAVASTTVPTSPGA
jgi:integration host factor subunit beta